MNLAQNTFEGGLMMDLHPLSTPNTVATNCLNGTYLTYNGNEYILLNDMGNGKVETALLPSGYIPLGTTSYGGIIYIVSYNPIKDLCQIGCFPSPERNFSYEELSEDYTIPTISEDNFKKDDEITNYLTKIKLTNITLNPGDKFLITLKLVNGEEEIIDLRISSNGNDCRISDYLYNSKESGKNPKYLRLRVATNDSSGRLIYLDSSVKWYGLEDSKYYFIPEDETLAKSTKATSMYSIFNSKISGELWLVASLESITSFSYTYSVDVESVESDDEEELSNIDTTLSGNGTENNPFIISTSSDFDEFSRLVSIGYNEINVEIDYNITDNITVNSSIGTETYPFKGKFNGNGKTLYYNYPNEYKDSYSAIFKYASNAEIYNIYTQGVIRSKNGGVGILVAYGESLNIHNVNITNVIIDTKGYSSPFIVVNNGTTTITNCLCNTNFIISNQYNGFVLSNFGNITFTNCFFNSSISNGNKPSYTFSENSTIVNCYSNYSGSQGIYVSSSDIVSGKLLSLLGDQWSQSGNYPSPIILYSNQDLIPENTGNVEDYNYNLKLDVYWNSDYWNETQKGIDPKYILFKSSEFYLKDNTSGEIDLSVYPDELNTVLFTEDKTGDIENRYDNIDIDLLNKLNHKQLNLGIIPSKYLIEDLDDSGNNKNDKERKFTITPAMEYGKLPTFELEGSINFALVGTGKTLINEWRYFKQDENIILTYGLEDYPQTGYETKQIVLEFINIDTFMQDGYNLRSGNYDNIIYNVGKSSYSGSFTTEIEFSDNFEENSLYLVRVIKKYGKKGEESLLTNIVGYRLLYTTDMFNDYYVSDTEDFSTLNIPTSTINSGLSMSNDTPTITQSNKMYIGDVEYDYDLNEIVVESNPKSYNKITCNKNMVVTGIKPSVKITSNYDLFSLFNTILKDSNISQYKDSDGIYDDTSKSINISSSISCTFDNYQQSTLNYKYSLIPLLKYNEDSSLYSLSFNPDTKHFYFDGFTVFGDDGYLGSGVIDYDDGTDIHCDNSEAVNNYEGTGNPYSGDNTSKSSYFIVNDEDSDLQYYRASGNQCYVSSQYQSQLKSYTQGSGNIIPMFFCETQGKEGKNSMTYTYTGRPSKFYHSSTSGNVTRFHILNASGNGGKKKQYDGDTGLLIYSDLINAYQSHEYGERICIGKSEPIFDSNKNIKYVGDRMELPTVSFLMKAINNSGDELHLFSNNWAMIGNRHNFSQNMYTKNAISFADILAMFLMQTYKYDSDDTEREVWFPTTIDDCEDSSTSTCILEVNSTIQIKDFYIGNYDRNKIVNKLNSIDISNLLFEVENDSDLNIEFTDYVQYSITADNLGKEDLTELNENNQINAILVKSCFNRKNYVFQKDISITENDLYMIDLDNKSYSKIAKSDDKYHSYYKLLSDFSYDSTDADFGFTTIISEGGNEYLEPEHLEILGLDEDKNLIIDLDEYKKIAKLTWTLNTTRNYSCSHISGISNKFTLSKLLNVLS